jgi:L-arabinose transport system ATP-binding protein
MAEIFEISNRVTVRMDGRVTGVRNTPDATHKELIVLMVGRALSFEPDARRKPSDAKIALELASLKADRLADVSFKLHYGEILCLAGPLGAERTETCEAISGARPILGEAFRMMAAKSCDGVLRIR